MGQVRVGAATAPYREAEIFVRRYLTRTTDHWAYPAYDGYPGGHTAQLSEQDLFAPALLNAGISSLSTYYAFLATLPELNARLAHVPLDVPLGRATDSQVEAVADLFAVLDDPGISGVLLTKLSKVLHRKRPQIVPLYDEHIRRCYQVGDEAPVPQVRGRTWRDFGLVWLAAVRTDLASAETSTWDRFAGMTPPTGPPITPLRALDIVGWGLGQPGRKTWKRVVGDARVDM